ncbi:MAG: conserved hypothetical transrane protein [Frankiales bacterium]|nr:conserved hypothetical transrane protein [Frankiales bacterium]
MRNLSGVTRHLPHLLMLVLPFLAFVGIFGVQWRTSSDSPLPTSLWVMGATTVASGGIHGAMVAHHAREAPALGWAMAVMCVVQLGWVVVLLFAPVRRTVELGVLGNLAIVVLWAWTRMVGVPFGIAGGLRQTVGPWDVACTLLEVGAVLTGLSWVWVTTGGPSLVLRGLPHPG